MRVTLTKIEIRRRTMIRTKNDMYYSLRDIINFNCYWSLNKETSTGEMGETKARMSYEIG